MVALPGSNLGQTVRRVWRQSVIPALKWVSSGTVRAIIVLVAVVLTAVLLYREAWRPTQEGRGLLPDEVTGAAPANNLEVLQKIGNDMSNRASNRGDSFLPYELYFQVAAVEENTTQ